MRKSLFRHGFGWLGEYQDGHYDLFLDDNGDLIHVSSTHKFSTSFLKGESNMQSKIWIWALALSAIFLVAACSPKGGTAESLVGTQAPAFQLADARGGQVALSDYTKQGKPVLLFFHMAVG
jgi:hypothetical protein